MSETDTDKQIKIGIIGGTGLEQSEVFEVVEEKEGISEYGEPSSLLKCGLVGDTPVVLLARHGYDHSIMPSEVNYRANVDALANEGCTHLLVATACGSLREAMEPGHFVVIDQFIDRTTKRKQTFYDAEFGKGQICHIPMGQPFCAKLRDILAASCAELDVTHHTQGTMVTIEGPRFSSHAESKMFRVLGGDVINMTTVPEVVLARERGLCYAALAMVTDYDSWHGDGMEFVDVDTVMKTMRDNADNAAKVLAKAIQSVEHTQCSCMDMHKTSIMGKKKEE